MIAIRVDRCPSCCSAVVRFSGASLGLRRVDLVVIPMACELDMRPPLREGGLATRSIFVVPFRGAQRAIDPSDKAATHHGAKDRTAHVGMAKC